MGGHCLVDSPGDTSWMLLLMMMILEKEKRENEKEGCGWNLT